MSMLYVKILKYLTNASVRLDLTKTGIWCNISKFYDNLIQAPSLNAPCSFLEWIEAREQSLGNFSVFNEEILRMQSKGNPWAIQGQFGDNLWAIRGQSEGNPRAIREQSWAICGQSVGNPRAIREQYVGNLWAIRGQSEGNPRAIRRQSVDNLWAICGQSVSNLRAIFGKSMGNKWKSLVRWDYFCSTQGACFVAHKLSPRNHRVYW